ncbi:hypothetical protein IE53DRAFT_112463 [Violaceomyces palustris]|uniref:Uncharacterized protein n=1 Tax=Violaceomyces palustris TaxID=1673888 RepID=A0ACD0P6X1_9BASI|nr:hypothetical protein IE53DRAFT_112463 [Violaceomyces palustris]
MLDNQNQHSGVQQKSSRLASLSASASAEMEGRPIPDSSHLAYLGPLSSSNDEAPGLWEAPAFTRTSGSDQISYSSGNYHTSHGQTGGLCTQSNPPEASTFGGSPLLSQSQQEGTSNTDAGLSREERRKKQNRDAQRAMKERKEQRLQRPRASTISGQTGT